MADGRKNNGGHSTKGKAGRKPKCEEQQLIEKLSPLADVAFKALEDGLKEGENWAVKLFFEYTYGKPRESVKIDATVENKVKEYTIVAASTSNTG